MSLDALVLAGGRSSRLGGTDKAWVVVGQGTLLEHALAGAERVGARRTVVVGPPGLVAAPVLCVQETPAFGGPAAGVAAGVGVLSADWVLVLACDLPRAPDVAVALRAALDELLDGAAHGASGEHDDSDRDDGDSFDGLCLQDATGRVQWLAGIYRRAALDRAVAALAGADGQGLTGAPVGRLLGRLALRTVADPTDVGADVDTWEDVDRARADAVRAETAPGATSPDGAQRSPTRPDLAPAAPTLRPDLTPPERGLTMTDPHAEAMPATPAAPVTPAAPPAVSRTLPPEALEGWLAALAAELGLDAGLVPIGAVLDIARDVANGVARPAAPLSTFLVGLAAAQRAAGGEDPAEALRDAARRTSDLAGRWADRSTAQAPTDGDA